MVVLQRVLCFISAAIKEYFNLLFQVLTFFQKHIPFKDFQSNEEIFKLRRLIKKVKGQTNLSYCKPSSANVCITINISKLS